MLWFSMVKLIDNVMYVCFWIDNSVFWVGFKVLVYIGNYLVFIFFFEKCVYDKFKFVWLN